MPINLIKRTEHSRHAFYSKVGLNFDRIRIADIFTMQADDITVDLTGRTQPGEWNIQKENGDSSLGERIDIKYDGKNTWTVTRTRYVATAGEVVADITETKSKSELPYMWAGNGAMPETRERPRFNRPKNTESIEGFQARVTGTLGDQVLNVIEIVSNPVARIIGKPVLDLAWDSTDAFQTEYMNRQRNADSFYRGYIGLITCGLWYFTRGFRNFMPGTWNVGNLNRGAIEGLLERLEQNFREPHQFITRHNESAWTAARTGFKIHRRRNMEVGQLLWTADNSAQYNEIVTAWFKTSLQTPQPRAVTISNRAPTSGTAITASIDNTDSNATVSAYQWQSRANRNIDDITSATTASYTPVAGDVGKQLRCVLTYKDQNYVTLAAGSNWTTAVS